MRTGVVDSQTSQERTHRNTHVNSGAKPSQALSDLVVGHRMLHNLVGGSESRGNSHTGDGRSYRHKPQVGGKNQGGGTHRQNRHAHHELALQRPMPLA